MPEVQPPQPRPITRNVVHIEIVPDLLYLRAEHRTLTLQIGTVDAGRAFVLVIACDDAEYVFIRDMAALGHRAIIDRHQDFGAVNPGPRLESFSQWGQAKQGGHRGHDDPARRGLAGD